MRDLFLSGIIFGGNGRIIFYIVIIKRVDDMEILEMSNNKG